MRIIYGMKFVKVRDKNGQEKVCSINNISLEKVQSESDTSVYYFYAHFAAIHKGSGNEYIKYVIEEAEYRRLGNILLNEEDEEDERMRQMGQGMGQVLELIKDGIKEAINEVRHPLNRMEVD